jgi:hypothetical protein
MVNGRELYDLRADPGEQIDIASSNPGEVARLRGVYERWFEELQSSARFRATEDLVGYRVREPNDPIALPM